MKSLITPILFFLLLFQFKYTVSAQNITISGYIQDKQSGEQLIGANVFLESTSQGTISNNYGFYSLTVPVSDSLEITWSYIGYASVTRMLKSTANLVLNIALDASIELDAVEVVAEKKKRIERETQMSVAEVPMSQLKKVPALLGEVDVLKALQLLPGVKSGGEGQSGLYVRGGGPDQNLLLLDGVPVYNASHLFGFFSVFNADAIKDVKLIKGGYPARYGGRLSSVLDISLKEGNINEFHGTATIGLIASKLTVEGPIWKGKTSFILSGRRTYLDILAQPIIKSSLKKENVDGGLGYFFYDLNAKVNHKFSDKDRIYLSAYTGSDKFYFRNKDLVARGGERSYGDNALYWGNLTTALRWNHVVNPRMFINTTATYSKYALNTDIEFGQEKEDDPSIKQAFSVDYVSGIRDIAVKVDVDYVPTPDHFIRFGANSIFHKFSPGEFKLLNVDVANNLRYEEEYGQKEVAATETALYVEDDYNVSKNIKVNFGLHFSTFLLKDESYFSLQPRASARYLLPQDWSVKASYASMRQYINLLAFEGIGLPTDLWVPATKRIPPQDSWQVALGTAKTFLDSYEFTTEVYYKKMKNLVAYKDGAGIFQTDDWQDRVVQGSGDAYGLEVFLQKKEGKFSGWIGYTLSWAYRQFPEIDLGEKFPYRFDRRHDISLVGNYNLSKRINLAATWVYSTGNAVTLPNVVYDSSQPGSTPSLYGFNDVQVFGQRNNIRMKSYHRLDVGVNFTKQKKHFERVFSFGAYNAYSNNNPFYVYVTSSAQGTAGNLEIVKELKQASLFPIIPYISWTANF